MDTEERIRKNIEDILQNHAQEIKTIEAQIDLEKATLEADLEEIRARVFPSVRYDTVRVQSSADPDAKMIRMMEAIERRQKRSERAIAPLEERKRQIEAVYQHVLCLDAKSKCVLLTLYYPKRTYEEAAEALEVDVSTIARRRNAAIASLVKRLKMSENESLHRKKGKAVRI